MKVSVEKLASSEAVLEVELSWDDLKEASDKAYRKLVKQVDVQGFRRGKAPRSLLERKLGKEYIYQEGLEELISETYRTTIKNHQLNPIAQPIIDAPTFEMDQPYHFSVRIPIITPAELGDYHSLHFEREEASVTSEEVEQELESMRSGLATWQVVERPAAIGDRVKADLKLTVGEQGISDLKENTFELTGERFGLFKGLDEQIVGMQAGDSKEFTTVIPADYTNEKLAGKEASYALKVYTVEARDVPELDDALAEQVSSGQYKTLEDLRKLISDSIYETKKRRINDELRTKVTDAVIEQSQVVVHPSLVHDEAEQLLHRLSHKLEEQQMSLDQFLKLRRKSREEYLQELEPEAEQRAKRWLVLDEVAKKEHIEIQPEELGELLQAYTEDGQPMPRTEAQITALILAFRREKALQRLVELAAGPDPDAVVVDEQDAQVTAVDEEEQSVTNATAAALAEGEPGEPGEPGEQVEREQEDSEGQLVEPVGAESDARVEIHDAEAEA